MNDENENQVMCERCENMVDDFEASYVYTRVRTVSSTSSWHNWRSVQQYWCQDCQDSHTFTCDDCGSTHDIDHYSSCDTGDRIVCEDCYSDNYFTCECCDNIFNNDHYGSEGMCEVCWDASDENPNNHKKFIKPYHNGHYNVKFIGKPHKRMPFIGFELEIESKDLEADELAEQLESYLTGFRVEEDGSLNDGFEIISNALTYKEHKRDSSHYRKLLAELSDNGARSHDTDTCGLHIHLSRKHLKERHIMNMVEFFLTNQSKIERFSRRKNNSYAEFRDYSECYRNKYSAINLKPTNTIEFRCFKGTLNHTTLMATIQFVHLFYLYTKDETNKKGISTSYLQWDNFISYVQKRKNQYKELNNYLVIRKLAK